MLTQREKQAILVEVEQRLAKARAGDWGEAGFDPFLEEEAMWRREQAGAESMDAVTVSAPAANVVWSDRYPVIDLSLLPVTERLSMLGAFHGLDWRAS